MLVRDIKYLGRICFWEPQNIERRRGGRFSETRGEGAAKPTAPAPLHSSQGFVQAPSSCSTPTDYSSIVSGLLCSPRLLITENSKSALPENENFSCRADPQNGLHRQAKPWGEQGCRAPFSSSPVCAFMATALFDLFLSYLFFFFLSFFFYK